MGELETTGIRLSYYFGLFTSQMLWNIFSVVKILVKIVCHYNWQT